MADKLLEPFISAATVTLREMAVLEVVVRDVKRTTMTEQEGDFSAYIELTPAEGELGWLGVSFPRAGAVSVATRVLSEVGIAPKDELILDCMGELTNVFAGQAKTLLLGTPNHFTLSTPMLIRAGRAFPLGERWVVRFASEIGEFNLYVRPPGEREQADSTEGRRQ